MTTIHVTINDPVQALRVVATLITQVDAVSIDLDEVSNLIEPNYITGGFIDARRVQAEPIDWDDVEQREYKKAMRATHKRAKLRNEPMPAIDEAEFLRRKQARDERYQQAHEAQTVECASCGARVGEFCVAPSGSAYKQFVHVDRIRAFRMAKSHG